MRWGGLLVGIVLSGCAASQPTTTVTSVRPTPEQYRFSVELSVRLGRQIAAQEAAPKFAVDWFEKRVAASSHGNTTAWVTLP